jgi:hypothetical protein
MSESRQRESNLFISYADDPHKRTTPSEQDDKEHNAYNALHIAMDMVLSHHPCYGERKS